MLYHYKLQYGPGQRSTTQKSPHFYEMFYLMFNESCIILFECKCLLIVKILTLKKSFPRVVFEVNVHFSKVKLNDLFSGVTHDAVNYVQRALLPDLSSTEAAATFARFIEESLSSWFTQVHTPV